ncbi:hypothetical protein [Azonexus sp.]|nr:hypothetical protein [Azonexus sp.]
MKEELEHQPEQTKNQRDKERDDNERKDSELNGNGGFGAIR